MTEARNDAAAYIALGDAYAKEGDYDRAIAEYTQAIRLDPNDVLAYYLRGFAYWNKGDYDRANADYKALLRIDPNDDYAKDALERME
jgi:cytochrome c-type biogenesis protein CcmH/NrfG